MHAYDDSYLPGAQRNLGEAFEYAILACGVGADEFSDRFIASGLALEWEEASPRVLAGISGTELARDALSLTGTARDWPSPIRAFSCPPEYWAGWVVAYYQWWSARSFRDIFSIAPASEIILRYVPFHEESENRFVDWMEGLAADKGRSAPLKTMRLLRGWSQRTLGLRSGVNVRSIRQYEQTPSSILQAGAGTVRLLAQAIGCRIDDLLPVTVPETT